MKLKIKSFPDGTSVSGKYQLLDPDERCGEKGKGKTHREKGYRALEAGEVIEFSDSEGEAVLTASKGVLEITTDEVTRPLYFEDQGTARATSASYNTDSPERAEEQQRAFDRVKELIGIKSEGTA